MKQERSDSRVQKLYNKDEQASLYYLAGYCLQALRNKNMVCSVCFGSAVTQEKLAGIGDLLYLKDYREGALCRATKQVYDAILSWEMVFRNAKAIVLSKNIRKLLMDRCSSLTDMPGVHLCHQLPAKLLGSYIDLRLRFICKDMTKSSQMHGQQLSSKSTAMRSLASKIK